MIRLAVKGPGWILGGTLVVVGAAVFLVAVLTPWHRGSAVPYAPGEDQTAARAAARTATGYTSGIVTVYEGAVAAIVPDISGTTPDGSYHLVLASYAPALYALQDLGDPLPPVLHPGDAVRAWSVEDIDASGAPQHFVVRLDAPAGRWLSGLNRYVLPIDYRGGSPAAVTVLVFGGPSGGALVALAGLGLLWRRGGRAWSLRPSELVAVAATLLAVPVALAWISYARYTGSERLGGPMAVLPLVFLLPAAGLVFGVVALATGTGGRRWLPALVGIVPAAAILLLVAAGAAVIAIGGCSVVYC